MRRVRTGRFLYVLVLSFLLMGAGVGITGLVLATLRDPVSHGEPSAGVSDFETIVSQTDRQVMRHLGEWEFSEPKLAGHFHHIGRWYQRDSWNFCIQCHGPIPHSRSAQIRAFLNMHTLFISCEVCHVRVDPNESPTRFGWIGLVDGSLSRNPRMDQGVWGEYGVKIIQMVGPSSEREPLVMHEERDFSAEFQKRSHQLDETQKVVANKFIHKRCIEKPVQCTQCHTSERSFLPFRELGYSKERTDFLVKPEVVDLVERYEKFLIPTLLVPENTDSGSPSVE